MSAQAPTPRRAPFRRTYRHLGGPAQPLARRGLTPPRPWAPLTDDQLRALWPYVVHRGAGRPIFDIRARLDAIFWVACHNGPWRDLPPQLGPHDTAHRQFRRWVHKGVWTQLLKDVATSTDPALRSLTHWVCRAWRRATRILGVEAIRLARRLGLLSALKGPPWMLPDPDLSERLWPLIRAKVTAFIGTGRLPEKSVLQAARSYHIIVGGRAWVPSWLAPP
jgi:transposase